MGVAFVQALASASAKAAGTTLAAPFASVSSTAGNVIVAAVIFDNAAVASKPIVSSLSKAAGETNNWVFLGAARSTSTSAGAFASGELWAIKTTVAWPSSTSITVTLDTSVTMKALNLIEYSGAEVTARSTAGTAYSTTTTAASATTTGTTPVVGDLVLGLLFQSNSSSTPTGDTDTTGGAWVFGYNLGSSGSSGATNNFGMQVYKILTAASHQTLNAGAAQTAGNGSVVAILQATPGPAITQSAYRFYDEGTESGSVALANQDTAPTVDVTVVNPSLHLRVRLQSTTAIAPLGTDEWQLQVERNASGVWEGISTSAGVGEGLCDSYSFAEAISGAAYGGWTNTIRGQSFLGDGNNLVRAKFQMYKVAGAVGTMRAVLFAHTGTFGAGGTGAGTVLATSTTVLDLSTLTTSAAVYSFDFDGTITLAAGVPYVIGMYFTVSGANIILPTDPTPAHAGNGVASSGGGPPFTWSAIADDYGFEVYTKAAPVAALNSPNLTHGQATTNRLTAGAGSFGAGEVSETGAVTDLAFAANTYTELLYPIYLKSAALVSGDTLRFRVIYINALFLSSQVMTYTQTPTIAVTKAAPLLATLTDTFTTTVDKVTKWPYTSAAVVWEAGQAKIPVTTSYWSLQTNLDSGTTYDFTSSSIYAKLTPPAVGAGSREMQFQVIPKGPGPYNDKVFWNISGANLVAVRTVGGTPTNLLSTTYSATNHAWLRLREASGTIYFDTSADGLTWVNFTTTTVAWAKTAVGVSINAGYYGTESAADAFIDYVNSPPPQPPNVGTATVSWTDGVTAVGKRVAKSATTTTTWAMATVARGVKTPPFTLTGLVQWWDVSDTSTITYGVSPAVAQLRDKSGTATHLTSAPANLNPVRVAGGIAPSLSNLTFTSQYMDTVAGSANQKPLTAFVVLKHDGQALGRAVISTRTTGGFYWELTTAQKQVVNAQYVVAVGTSTSVVPSNTPALVEVSYSATGDLRFYLNGIADGAVTNNQTFNSANPATTIGEGIGQPSTGVQIGEILKYDRVLTDPERQAVEQYLLNKWTIVPPTPALWLDADDASTFTLSGATVTQWRDKSGGARNFSGGTATRNGTIANRTSVVVTGPAGAMSSAAPVSTVVDNFAMFVVCRRTGGVANSVPFFNGNGAANGIGPAVRAGTTKYGLLRGGLAWHESTTADDAGTHIHTLTRSSTYEHLVDGIATSLNGGAFGAPNAPTVGAYIPASVVGHDFAGDVCEIVYYDRALTATERQRVENYLLGKWKLQSGTATTLWTEALTSVGAKTPKAAASTTYAEAVAAAGKKTQKSTLTTTYTEATAAAGKKTPKSATTTTWTAAVAAIGARPAVAKTGSGTVAWNMSTLGGGVVGPTVYSDDFNRSNGVLVAPWVTIEGTHSIVSNKLVVGPASPNTSYYDQTFAADQWSEADLDNEQDSAGVIFPTVRTGSGGGGDYYYFWVGAPGTRPVQINKRVGGVYANIAQGSSPMPTGPFKARLEVQGTTVSAYVNGVLQCSVTDTSIATGRPGVLSANGTGGTFDNWRGGDLPYTPPVYTDNFNRANGDLGSSPGWATANQPIQITSNHLDINSNGCACKYTGATFPATSHWAEGLMTIQNGQEGSLGPTVRQGSGENSYYAWIRGPNNPPTFEIWRQWLGGYTQIGGYAIPVPAAATGPVRVGIEVDSLTIRGYVEGVLAITWVEDNPGNAPTGDAPGVGGGMFGAANGVVQMDDFRCGSGRYTPVSSGGGGGAIGKETPVGAATTTWTMATTAAGKKTPKSVAATTTYTEAVAASGKKTPKSAPTTTYTEAVAAAGKKIQKATLTTTYTEAVAAAGKKVPKATAPTTWTEATSAVGKKAPKATATVSHFWACSATATTGTKAGTGVINNVWATTAIGKRAPKAAVTTTYLEALVSVGKRVPKTASITFFTEAAAAAGKETPKATATTTWTEAPVSVGKETPKGLATTISNAWATSAVGVKPIVGAKQGSGLAQNTWVTAAVGKRAPKATAISTYAEVLTALGKKIQKSTVTTTFTETPVSVGKRAPKGSNSVAVTSATSAVGKKTPKGAGSTGFFTYNLIAQGVAPLVGSKAGSAVVFVRQTTDATGKKVPKGGNSTSHLWATVATGTKPLRGAAAVTYLYQTTAAGKKTSKSEALGTTYAVVTEAAGRFTPKASADTYYTFVGDAFGAAGIVGSIVGQLNGLTFDGMQFDGKPVVEFLLVPS